ncbi:MAG: hypothetical protein QXU18_00245 [Thermoplasmatales archaeon]
MIKLLAETPRDQKIIDALKKAEKWKDRRIEYLEKEKRKLQEELEEYRKRHPGTVGVKNGKSYVIMESLATGSIQENRKPRAQKGHAGRSGSIPRITEGYRSKRAGINRSALTTILTLETERENTESTQLSCSRDIRSLYQFLNK